MIPQKPILLTGCHRSGSTWVAKILATSSKLGYIHEPFNLNHRPGICAAKFDYWFTYITQENEYIYTQQIQDTICFSYNLAEEFNAIKSPKDFLRLWRDYKNFNKYRFLNARPFIKDPIAFFAAEWLAQKFKMDVVILIRHPCAFASSIKIKKWLFPFSDFLQQPLLMKHCLSPFEAEIRRCAEQQCDLIEQSILLWKIFYFTVIKYKEKHKDWIFIRHEDISQKPLLLFQNLFEHLNLEFSEETIKTIEKYSNPINPKDVHKDFSSPPIGSNLDLKRDSKANILNWQNRLTTSEINRIRTQVEDIAKNFYCDDDWQ